MGFHGVAWCFAAAHLVLEVLLLGLEPDVVGGGVPGVDDVVDVGVGLGYVLYHGCEGVTRQVAVVVAPVPGGRLALRRQAWRGVRRDGGTCGVEAAAGQAAVHRRAGEVA